MKIMKQGILMLLAYSGMVSAFGHTGYGKVLLTNVNVLTLRKGEYTTHRRVNPIKQLDCVRGCSYENYPDVMQCYNKGSDGTDVNWKCETDLPNGAKLRNVNVQCEGYDSPDDPYILAGSCGVTFEVYQSYQNQNQNRDYRSYDYASSSSSNDGFMNSFFVIAIMFGLFYFIAKLGRSMTVPMMNSYPVYGGGGGGWNSWNPMGGFGGWRPGFFSGLGLGGILGSAWSRPRYRGNGWWGGGSPTYYATAPANSSYSMQSNGSSRQSSYATTSRR
jgi:hypothetical protein